MANDPDENSALEWLKDEEKAEKCSWCRFPHSAISSGGLCGRCYSLSRKEVRLRKSCDVFLQQGKDIPFQLKFAHQVAEKMVQFCKDEGSVYGSPASQEVSPLDLEHELVKLGGTVAGKEGAKLFDGMATPLGWSFEPAQLALIRHLIGKLNRLHARRVARTRASYSSDILGAQ